jgi:hypothetical protein
MLKNVKCFVKNILEKLGKVKKYFFIFNTNVKTLMLKHKNIL